MFMLKRTHKKFVDHCFRSLDQVIAIAESQTQKVADLQQEKEVLDLQVGLLRAALRLANLRLDLAARRIYVRDTQPDLAWVERLGMLEDPRSGS